MKTRRSSFHGAYMAVRPSVLKRDSGKCVKCSSTVRIEVHHVNGYEDNNSENLQTLCYLCHGVAPMGDDYWEWKRNGQSGWVHFSNAIRSEFPNFTDKFLIDSYAEIQKYQKIMNYADLWRKRKSARESSGRCEGVKPYGHDPNRPGEVLLLAKMISLSETLTSTQICRILNSNGDPPRGRKGSTAGIWYPSTIQNILKANRTRNLPL